MIANVEKRNERGETLKEFLAKYNPDKYKHPSTTVDMIVATVQDNSLKVLLVKRKDHPFIGCWATPAGSCSLVKILTRQRCESFMKKPG